MGCVAFCSVSRLRSELHEQMLVRIVQDTTVSETLFKTEGNPYMVASSLSCVRTSPPFRDVNMAV